VNNEKRSSEILADENRKISLEKAELKNCSTESEKFFGNRGEIWNRGEMHHCLRGMDASAALLAPSHVPHVRHHHRF